MRRKGSNKDNGKFLNKFFPAAKNKSLPLLMLLISTMGFSLFYLIPFIVSSIYSFWNNPISREYCGFRNYVDLFDNMYFLRGLKNTAMFMGIAIPMNICFSLVVALIMQNIKWYKKSFSMIFLIPLAIPSATAAFFWENFFGLRGTLNKFLAVFGFGGVDWLNSKYSLAVMVVIFIWKNIGYNMALFLSGLSSIPNDYYEVAAVEGAGWFWKFRNITLVYLSPTTFLVFIMTFVNSFKVFKEIYIITGDYPPEHLYVLQHYMNNMFLTLNYSKLVSAVYILTFAIVMVVAVFFGAERKVAANIHY